ncbi:hypothetical protein M404DRAFT_633899 [Pisolithus tinctorius Marx 270]|uniref:Uncharacterized protein n=1 Tax=Pisolithus tinctorius Marx 270 TaxID=870435 RepID=A0A0C3P6B4_PISTI|nr:hypothetical protein M404DRAFT_633899 [Pisolithus tinctorius Marx 270]
MPRRPHSPSDMFGVSSRPFNIRFRTLTHMRTYTPKLEDNPPLELPDLSDYILTTRRTTHVYSCFVSDSRSHSGQLASLISVRLRADRGARWVCTRPARYLRCSKSLYPSVGVQIGESHSLRWEYVRCRLIVYAMLTYSYSIASVFVCSPSYNYFACPTFRKSARNLIDQPGVVS